MDQNNDSIDPFARTGGLSKVHDEVALGLIDADEREDM